MGFAINLQIKFLEGLIMTVLQLMLLLGFGLVALVFYKTGYNDGVIEGRIESFQEQR